MGGLACRSLAWLLASLAPLGALADPPPLPRYLHDTGLYLPGSMEVQPGILGFTPQYPLWSDGARKQRWLSLPPGTTIEASNPDAWEFPPGSRLWKEFSLGRRVETRFIERLPDGNWRYATYAWNAEQTKALLVPARGTTVAVADAPGGRYRLPARTDCRACHEGAAVPVLGFSALQLSPDRDQRAPHAEAPRPGDADLRSLVAHNLIRGLPKALLDTPPRIRAPTPGARAALGYLHGNCGHCHNDAGPLASLGMVLAQPAAGAPYDANKTLVSLTGAHVTPGDAGASPLVRRLRAANPMSRMPPLGVQLVDHTALAAIEAWITHDFRTTTQPRKD